MLNVQSASLHRAGELVVHSVPVYWPFSIRIGPGLAANRGSGALAGRASINGIVVWCATVLVVTHYL